MNTKVKKIEEGPIVAVQYPDTIKFSSDENKALELGVKYAHLKQLDVDDKAAYKELTAAIKDVKGHRTDNKKEEDVIKKPLNIFRSLVIATGKSVQEAFGKVETVLVLEKSRIDDIKAERAEAQRRLWNDNLQMIRGKARGYHGADLAQLNNHLDILKACDLGDWDFGDLIEDAKESLQNNFMVLEQLIAQENNRLQMEEDRRQLDKEKEEREAEEIKRREEQDIKDREAADVKARIDADNKRMREELDALKKEKELKPKPQKKTFVADLDDNGDIVKPLPDSTVAAIGEASKMFFQRVSASEQPVPAATFDDEEEAPSVANITPMDCAQLLGFAELLDDACKECAITFDGDHPRNAINRVIGNISKTITYLKSVAEGGPA